MSLMDRIRKGIINLDNNIAKAEKKEEKKVKKFDLSKALDTLEEGYGTKVVKSEKKASGTGIVGKLDALEAGYSKPQKARGFWDNAPSMGSTLPGKRQFYDNTGGALGSTLPKSSLAHEQKRKKKHKKDED